MRCIDWIDRESNRCCVYIAPHLAWLCCISTIRTYEPNDDDDRMFHVKFCSFCCCFCFSVTLRRFIHFLLSASSPCSSVHSLFCFVPILNHSFNSLSTSYNSVVCVRHLFFVIMPGATMTASSRAAWRLCVLSADALLPSPRVIFIFVSHSVRVVGYSIQCCSLDTFSRSLTQHCHVRPYVLEEDDVNAYNFFFSNGFWARLVLMGSFGGVCRWCECFFFFCCSLFSFFSFRFSANTILDVWEQRALTQSTAKKMDVMNSNASDRSNKKKFKRPNFNAKIKQFSIEIYFMWFSALIYLAETVVGECGFFFYLRPSKCVRVWVHVNK